jgi:hypothetical protein
MSDPEFNLPKWNEPVRPFVHWITLIMMLIVLVVAGVQLALGNVEWAGSIVPATLFAFWLASLSVCNLISAPRFVLDALRYMFIPLGIWHIATMYYSATHQ